MSPKEADVLSQGMYKYCPDVEGYYIQGAPCMMKRNISPPLGYANGSQGKMIGIVPKQGNVLPAGAPGEMIMIEPPEYVIMEVTHKKGDRQWTTIVPCKSQKVTLDYRKDGEDKKFSCYSNSVNLMFAFTIHETQGQTLKKVILLLGRMPGLNVGQTTWSLLYVALSRTKELKDIKFFPCGNHGFRNFKHLINLKPSSKFVKWKSGYRNHVWCPEILETKALINEMNVRNKLVRQGPGLSLGKTKDILIGYLTGLGFRIVKKTERPELQMRIMTYMEGKKLWKLGEDKAKYLTKRGSRKRKKSQTKKILSQKSRKLSHTQFSQTVLARHNSGSVKAKRKLSNEKLSHKKKKMKKKVVEDPDRFFLPEELIFEKFLYDRKGYRFDPIKRDGNCLFRAVAGIIHGDTDLYDSVKRQCIDFMIKEKEYFRSFIEIDGVRFDNFISQLRREGGWGGNNEIVALSAVFNCEIEVYENTENPTKLRFHNLRGNAIRIIRLYYKNDHYSIVRSDGFGWQLFNFQGLQKGELQRQMDILTKAGDPNHYSESQHHLSLDDQKFSLAQKLSREEYVAKMNYFQFYTSKLRSKNVIPRKKKGSVKLKRKLPKTKNKNVQETDRFLWPDELLYEKFLLEKKGYRIDPIKRDGNCLFRAVAGVIHENTDMYDSVKTQCINFLKKEKEYFRSFIEVDGDLFDNFIARLRLEGGWGGQNEIIALSAAFNCEFEVYENNEVPKKQRFHKLRGSSIRTIRLYYQNNHYSIVRSDGFGWQLFNFQGLQQGELERQMDILQKAGEPNQSSEIEQHSSCDDQKLAEAQKLSHENYQAEEQYKAFYASRLISNQ